MSEQIPFPDKIISWFDIAKGIGFAALHFLGDSIRHETPSEHFVTDAVASERPDPICPDIEGRDLGRWE